MNIVIIIIIRTVCWDFDHTESQAIYSATGGCVSYSPPSEDRCEFFSDFSSSCATGIKASELLQCSWSASFVPDR